MFSPLSFPVRRLLEENGFSRLQRPLALLAIGAGPICCSNRP